MHEDEMVRTDEAVDGGHFSRHLLDAIELNQHRQKIYATMTQGRSRKLSRHLIRSEKLSLPVARFFDWRARRFNRQGICIVAGDFVSMDAVVEPQSPPVYTSVASRQNLKKMKQSLANYRNSVLAANRRGNFVGICELTAKMIGELEEREAQENAHYAMSKHILESIGLAALNAPQYSADSDGKTKRLSRGLIFIQTLPLTYFFSFDAIAQPLHQEGCGILINDIPAIPFIERWTQ